MKPKRGFVLLSTLMLMQVCFFLSMVGLEQLVLAQKIVADQKTKRRLLNEAEQLLLELAAHLNERHDTCFIPSYSPRALQSFKQDWWDANACVAEGRLFKKYYVLEDLGEDPCAQAAFYRLTVFIANQQDRGIKVLLQSTVAVEKLDLEHCDHRRHSVDLGPQSWLELI